MSPPEQNLCNFFVQFQDYLPALSPTGITMGYFLDFSHLY